MVRGMSKEYESAMIKKKTALILLQKFPNQQQTIEMFILGPDMTSWEAGSSKAAGLYSSSWDYTDKKSVISTLLKEER